MVPDVEEVGREPKSLAFCQTEVLDERKIPVLLERPAVDVAAKISKVCPAEVGVVHRIARGSGIRRITWIQQGCSCEVVNVQVTGQPIVNVAAGLAGRNGTTGSQSRSQSGGKARPEECRPRQ